MTSTPLSLLLINGPNLNLLGLREPGVYGARSLAEVEEPCVSQAQAAGSVLACFQANAEGAIIDRIHAAWEEGVDGIIINAGAYTHTSIAIRDALLGVAIPFIEVHISNVYARETFRHHSYLSDKAAGVIVGLGTRGYSVALEHALATFAKRTL